MEEMNGNILFLCVFSEEFRYYRVVLESLVLGGEEMNGNILFFFLRA